MKKLLFVLALGAFAACGDSTTESSTETTETVVETPTEVTHDTMVTDTVTVAPVDTTVAH